MRLLLPFLVHACASDDVKQTAADSRHAAQHDSEADGSASARLHEDIGSLVYVSWEQTEAASTRVEYRPEGEDWRQTPTSEREAGSHEQLLLGIPFGTWVEYRVVHQIDKTEVSDVSGAITTGPLPEDLPEIERIQASKDAWDADVGFFLTSTNQEGASYEGHFLWWSRDDHQQTMVMNQANPSVHS